MTTTYKSCTFRGLRYAIGEIRDGFSFPRGEKCLEFLRNCFFPKKNQTGAIVLFFVICSDFLEFFIYPLAHNNESFKTWFNCQMIRGVGSTPAGLMKLILLFFFPPRDNSSITMVSEGWTSCGVDGSMPVDNWLWLCIWVTFSTHRTIPTRHLAAWKTKR